MSQVISVSSVDGIYVSGYCSDHSVKSHDVIGCEEMK